MTSVKLFSAMIDPELDGHSSAEHARQSNYFQALRTLPRVRVILGEYKARRVRCRSTCRNEYQVPEEKKTDVNIAVAIIDDAIKSIADTIVVVSGDVDLEPAIQWVRKNKPAIKIVRYIPAIPEKERERRGGAITEGVEVKFLPLEQMDVSQLPDEITLLTGLKLKRPDPWKKI